MDASALRARLDAALDVQAQFGAADAALNDAKKAREVAAVRMKSELDSLYKLLGEGFVIYGDRVLQLGIDRDLGTWRLKSSSLTSVRVAVPPVAPLPEVEAVKSMPAPVEAPRSTPQPLTPLAPAPPTSGGIIPPLGKKR